MSQKRKYLKLNGRIKGPIGEEARESICGGDGWTLNPDTNIKQRVLGAKAVHSL